MPLLDHCWTSFRHCWWGSSHDPSRPGTSLGVQLSQSFSIGAQSVDDIAWLSGCRRCTSEQCDYTSLEGCIHNALQFTFTTHCEVVQRSADWHNANWEHHAELHGCWSLYSCTWKSFLTVMAWWWTDDHVSTTLWSGKPVQLDTCLRQISCPHSTTLSG